MNAGALNQTQPWRCIDHISRNGHASDQEHVRLFHLSRKRPGRVKLLDHELGPEYARDHVLDRQTWTGLLNQPFFAHHVAMIRNPSAKFEVLETPKSPG
jgi:hypothetical protein